MTDLTVNLVVDANGKLIGLSKYECAVIIGHHQSQKKSKKKIWIFVFCFVLIIFLL